MNNNVKILLTIDLEGGTLVRQSNIELIPYNITRDLSDRKTEKGYLKHTPKIPKRCIQRIKLTQDAYDNFLTLCPHWINVRIWKKMNDNQRLEAHLWNYCKDLGGTSYSYQVLGD